MDIIDDDMTDAEIDELLKRMHLERVVGERYGFLRRLKCRVLGPHEWIPLSAYEKTSGALIEIGMVCDICHKEVS